MQVKRWVATATVLIAGIGVSGCSSTRQVDPDRTGSWKIPGTSWYGFCQGRNAFIWIPSRNNSEPDELEAVIYDDYRCVGQIESAQPSSSTKPDADPDGIVDDEE